MAFSLNSLNNIFFLAPYFVEIQRKSFLNLLNHGLIYELSKRSLIIDSSKKFKLIFYPKQYKLSLPKYTPKQAILKKKTYGSKLYIPLQLKTNKLDESYLRWVKVAYLPLMTKRGHFIINGSPRVIVNQLIRSPGIYYRQKIDKKKIKTHYADLISFRGAWLRLETDRKQRMWIRMKKTPKIPLLTFLLATGASFYKIDKFIHYPDYLKNSVNEKKYEYPTGIQNALSILYELVEPRLSLLYFNERESADEGKKFLFRKFFNPRTYDLSYLGRTQLNKKFQYSFSSNSHVLTLQDLLVATDYLIKLEYNSGRLDDIDHLKNRRVRASGELIQNQLGTGFLRLEKLIRKKFINKKVLAHTIFTVINPKPITGALREFFGSSPLSQFMDQTNPLAELTHKRRVSALGPGGINRETAGIAVRGIHPTHYGRVCPIETPEGRNAGLVNSLTTFARINSHGFLETPFYSVYSGQVQKYGGLYFFSAAQEEHIISAPGDLKTDYFYNLPVKKIPARENNEFYKFYKNKIEYISISPIQMISIATSLIPFLEHDDGNRALMGSNMQRQAVPLLIPEKVIVGTGLEPRIISDSGHGIQAEKSGFVSAVTSKMITIKNMCPIPNTTTLLDNIQLQKNFKFNSRLNFPFYSQSNFYKNYSINGSLHKLRNDYTLKPPLDSVIFKEFQNSLNEQNVNKLKPSLNKISHKQKTLNPNFDKKVKKKFLNKNIFKMYLDTKWQDILSKNTDSILLCNNTENAQLFNLNPLTVNFESSYKFLSLKQSKNTKFTLKFAQKSSFFFMNLKKHKKFLTKNFLCLSDLFFYKNFSTFLNLSHSEITSQQLFKTCFNSIPLNNKLEKNSLSTPNKLGLQQKILKENWVGFKKIEILQSQYLFSEFFIQQKNWSKFQYTKKIKFFLMQQNDFLKNLDLNGVPKKLFYKLHFIKLSQDINQQNYFYLNLVDSTFWLTTNSEKQNLKYIFEKKILSGFNNYYTNKEKNFFDSKFLWYKKKKDIQTTKTKFKLKENLNAKFQKINFSPVELTPSHLEKKIIYNKINKFLSKKQDNLKNKSAFNWNKIIILPNYKNNEFFKFNLFRKNRQKNIQNLAFVCQNKLLQREKFISKIHFLTLSQKNRKVHYKALQNLLQTHSNLFFTSTFLIKCINFIFIQTSYKKEIFKYFFFYTSLAWNTQCTQNFSYFSVVFKFQYQGGITQENIKRINKSYKLILKSPYIKKKDPSVLDLLLHNDYYPNKIFGNGKVSKEKNLFNKKSKTGKFKSALLHGSKNTPNTMYSTLKKFRSYKKTQLRNQKKIVKKIVENTTVLNSLQIQNLNFSPQFYFLQENTNYFIQSYQSSNQKTCVYQKPLVHEGEWVQKGDLLTDGAASVNGELSLGKTILVAYMPWEGYNFEDAIVISERLNNKDIYTSIHIERYETEICETGHGIEKITAKIPNISFFKKRNLDKRGVIKVGSWVQEGDILVGKVTPIKIKPLSNYDKLLAQIEGKPKPVTKRNSSLQVPNKKVGRVIHVEIFTSENILNEFNNPIPSRVRVYIAEKRKLEVGDKMSGRHGNKGIISKILPIQDMPYLPDGTPIDMILNPLGVPSRMNVGQIFECLLGLAGKELKQQFKISSFDEMNGPEASRSLTYSKLFEARIKTKKKWLFNPNSPGKMYLFDGRTGECFHQTVTVGRPYILKLVHVVDEKIHARSTGPYSLVTQQPLRGRSKHGGQRLGEMEVWALEGFGAAYILQEVLTNKSDDMKGRRQVMNAILKKKIITLGTPEAFRVLLSELQSLCIDIGVYTFTDSGIRKPIHMIPRTMPKFIKKS